MGDEAVVDDYDTIASTRKTTAKMVTAIVTEYTSVSIEVSLECAGPANVQGDAMETAARHFGVSQREPDDINVTSHWSLLSRTGKMIWINR